MINKQAIKEFLEYTISNGDPTDRYYSYGLCQNIYEFIAIEDFTGSFWQHRHTIKVSAWLEVSFRSWGEFSGNIKFPVKYYDDNGVSDELPPEKAFYTLPRYSGEYGKARIRLAQHLLDNIDSL